MAAAEPTGDVGRIEDRSSLVSTAFAALSVLFDECVRYTGTPLDIEGSDRLTQRFDETIEHIVQELDELSFGSALSLPTTISCAKI